MWLDAPAETSSELSPVIYRQSAWQVIFSFPVVLGFLLVALTVFTVRSRFNDPDLWYHLKIGQIIWNTHSIPRVDLFSFTAFGHPWVAQEWLSQVTFYGVYRLAGYSGLMLLLCVLPSLIILGVFLLSALYSGNVKVAFLGGLIAWMFSTVGMAVRPHLIGYLLLVCELLILQLGRSRNARWFLALPLLFAVWINFHGSFFFGLVILGVVLFCSFLQVEWGLIVSQRWEVHQRRILGIAAALSLPALFVNPLGLRLVVNPLEAMIKLPVNLAQVSEWQPTHFDEARGFCLLAVAGLIVLIPMLRRADLTCRDLLLTVLVFGFAALHERMVFLFGIVAGPLLCRHLGNTWDRYKTERDHPLANVVIISISLLGSYLIFPSRFNLDGQITRENPVKALEYIKRSGLTGPMMNEYVYGGYLIWAAPEHRVFIDGRADIFELAGTMSEYGDWIRANSDPRVLLEKYRISFCLLARDSPVVHTLDLLPRWNLVYSDKSSVVYVRKM